MLYFPVFYDKLRTIEQNKSNFLKRNFKVDPSVRTKKVTFLVNLGMLDFTYRFQASMDYSFAVRYLVDSEATLLSIPESQCGYFQHDDCCILIN